MSAHRRRVELSPRASLDYEDILLHSLRTWGESRTRRFQAELDHAIAELGEFPEIASVRHDVSRELRGRLVQQHVIFYRIEQDSIDVKRILHTRRDIRREPME